MLHWLGLVSLLLPSLEGVGLGPEDLSLGFTAARSVLEWPLAVSGYCLLSIFDGSGAVSLGMMMTSVPTICPWELDMNARLDVLGNAHVSWKLALSGRVCFSWLATPCRSWTPAQRPMLRSWDAIYGLPSVAMWGTDLQRRLVMEGNALTLFTVMYA